MELNNQADPQVSIVPSPDAGVVAGACDSQLPNPQASHLEVEAYPRPRSELLPLLRKEPLHEGPEKERKLDRLLFFEQVKSFRAVIWKRTYSHLGLDNV